MTQPKEQQIEVELSAEIAEGTYSNLAIITHSNAEFIVDFINMMPGKPKANVKSRIILTPQHAKRLMSALIDNVNKYESHFGKIIESGGDQRGNAITFAMPAAQA
ncbi:MAG: DUF3467 domain-containing protein [Bacteroidales bacterium]|jgi:hypothetical protein|nr:DUF3467 domain-containing protein [Bacteroidales bacterium]